MALGRRPRGLHSAKSLRTSKCQGKRRIGQNETQLDGVGIGTLYSQTTGHALKHLAVRPSHLENGVLRKPPGKTEAFAQCLSRPPLPFDPEPSLHFRHKHRSLHLKSHSITVITVVVFYVDSSSLCHLL